MIIIPNKCGLGFNSIYQAKKTEKNKYSTFMMHTCMFQIWFSLWLNVYTCILVCSIFLDWNILNISYTFLQGKIVSDVF